MSIREMDMMLHLAAESSAAAKEAQRKTPLRAKTEATIENAEWTAFKARLQEQRRFFRAPGVGQDGEGGDADEAVDAVDEDDMDTMLALIDVLDAARQRGGAAGQTLTLSEIVRALQRDRVLSLEFTAAARTQAQRLLTQLRALNKVYQSPLGGWALL